jgi:hypothetical protein
MKAFIVVPGSRTYGVLYDDQGAQKAIFLTPGEAKFEAAFKTIREAQR